jgi:hypothetical protein
VVLKRRQSGLRQAFVNCFVIAAAVQDHVDAPQGEPVPARFVGGVAQVARAVVGGVDVEAAVGLSQRSHVSWHFLRPEQLVEADQIGVTLALGDAPR